MPFKDPLREKAYRKLYYQQHKEEFKAREKAKRLSDPEGYRRASLRYYKKNADKRLAYQKEYSRSNQEKIRNRYFKSRYGLSLKEVEKLKQKYNNKCANANCNNGTGLVVDHDHVTGKVRGILCNKCNLLLGIAADQHNYLTGLAQYLQTFNPEE